MNRVALFGVCVVTSVATTWAVRTIARRRGLLDRPNSRSAHVRPTPRLGGIGVMAGFLPAAVAVVLAPGGAAAAWAVVATAVVSGLGLVDDVRPLRARTRFVVQLLAAALVVWAGRDALAGAWTLLPGAPRWILVVVSILWITWVTNLYNFMDGIDGLAGGQAVVASAALAAAAISIGALPHAWLALALSGAALGFLFFNFPPASIFMGDVGSTAIGFLLAALPFIPGPAVIPVEAVFLAIALFFLDATTTLLRRLARGERFFQAHRTHWYQRPLACGVPHRAITLAAYEGMVVSAAAALWYPSADVAVRLALLFGVVALFLLYASIVVLIERRAAASQRVGDASEV